MKNPESTWFGEKTVKADEKTGLVLDVFHSVANKYDLMNDLMSAGTHRIWKERFVSMIRPRADQVFLDVAGGTGDIAFKIRKKIGKKANITICDINESMLKVGQERAIDNGYLNEFEFLVSNAENLPLPDNSIDVYTISFGLRNVTHIDKALEEAHRVLVPGGSFYCLEFSHVKNPLLAKAYDLYSEHVIPHIGQIVAHDSDSYKYLIESIRKHPNQENLKKRLLDSGFDEAKYMNMSGGIVAIHKAIKL